MSWMGFKHCRYKEMQHLIHITHTSWLLLDHMVLDHLATGTVYKVQITVNNICLLSHASALTALKTNNTLLSVGSHAALFMVNLIYLQYFCFNN